MGYFLRIDCEMDMDSKMFISRTSLKPTHQEGRQDRTEEEVVIATKVSAHPMGTLRAGMTSRLFPIRARWPKHPNLLHWKDV